MKRFPGQLRLRSLSPDELNRLGSPRQLYELEQDFAYSSTVLGWLVTVPAGYTTDFASIPRVVWNLLDPEDPVIGWPSVQHDFLYTCAGRFPDGFTYTRQQADAVLREGMEDCGASSLLRNAVYYAVRLGGNSHWLTPPNKSP